MKILSLLVLTVMIVFSCTGQTKNTQNDKIKLADFIIKTEVSDNETYTVSGSCALLIQQSDQEADSLESEGGDEYAEYTDDENSASLSAFEMLERLNIKTLNTDKRYIKFTLINQSDPVIIDTRKKEKNLIGYYIFFKANKQPIISESVIISEDLINEFFIK